MKRRARRSSAQRSPTKAELAARVEALERSLARERARRKALANALTTSAEQQAATADILRVISNSPSNVQPVFDAALHSSIRLVGAFTGTVCLISNGVQQVVAFLSLGEAADDAVQHYSGPVDRSPLLNAALRERRPLVVNDVLAAATNLLSATAARARGYNSLLLVPMIRGAEVIGTISVGYRARNAVTDTHVELLKTFADQAVIAIENVRLLTELQEKNRSLSEALAQQTATAEILRIISSSPTDVQPVFDAIVTSAVRLLGGFSGVLARLVGDELRLAASTSTGGAGDDALRSFYPFRVDSNPIAVKVIREKAVFAIADTEADLDIWPEFRDVARARGFRSDILVPLIRDDRAVGLIAVTRREPHRSTDEEIALLQTFATQAVIAIENVRLFTELEEKNHALTESLDQQTATSEVLRVISRSPTDVQPVFDAIATSARELCRGLGGAVFTYDGLLIHLAAVSNVEADAIEALRRAYPMPVSRASASSRAILEHAVVMIADVFDTPGYEHDAVATAGGFRSVVAVPMLRDGAPIGCITVTKSEPRAFTNGEVHLLSTFADQAVIAIENVRLFTELQEKNRAVTEALERQTATGEILRAISQSPTDVQPVFDSIVESAARLCRGIGGSLLLFDGELVHLAAVTQGGSTAAVQAYRKSYPRPVTRELAGGRAIVDRTVVHIPDTEDDPEPHLRGIMRNFGLRAMLVAPMLREDAVLGALVVSRVEPGPFTAPQIELLKTFADQAVIAIENVRLFTELQEKNRALTEAHAQVTKSLNHQTATSDILRVISRSPTSVEPVFESIVHSSVRLLGGLSGVLMRVVGDEIHLAALTSTSRTGDDAVRAMYPILRSAVPAWQAVDEQRPLVIEDTETDPRLPERAREMTRARGVRSQLLVPMVRDTASIGLVVVTRAAPGGFTADEIDLLKTFADQAVIAIENVRLFTELQEKNRAVTEALEQQTATSEILRVISQSPTDSQPVFDTVVRNAVQLCGAAYGRVYRLDGEVIHLVANYNVTPQHLDHWQRTFPRPLSDGRILRQVLTTGRVLSVPDVFSQEGIGPSARATFRDMGVQSALFVPMLRQGQVVGEITLMHRETAGFNDTHVALLETFADQAVIAIENVRLFTELQQRTRQLTRSVDELTALGEVSRAVSSTLDLETVLTTIVTRANELCGTDGAGIYEFDVTAGAFRLRATKNFSDELIEASRTAPLRHGEGIMGRLAETRQPMQIPDITVEGAYQSRVRDILIRNGYRALLSVPLLRDEDLIGALTVGRQTAGEFPAGIVDLLRTFASQSSLAIQNARLFHELEIKSRELEVASRHKSEFLASMSHELRTPLNAVIGFSDVLLEQMFGEVNDKQAEYLRDILASGKHLLSLINDILDLSKIEAGRMELDLTEFDLPLAIDNALTLMRERASRRGIALQHAVDERLGEIRADERKVKQVLLNLLSNAVKFTPEGGRIDVRAALADGTVEISVTDTGIGIAPADHTAVFEEFRQVGRADRKAEGTGLGLALCRKFVELHGGRIWLKSEVGHGSTFTFTLPLAGPVSDRGH
ncbi:MAG: GAF domain-containing protein [Candidatus Rokubacteria bacterium]|nr:GAF domain-containing protein [Candidatus Rokubacteria bacterium]